MTRKEYHIIVTGESGSGYSFIFGKKRLQTALCFALAGLTVLFIGTLTSIGLFSTNHALKKQIAGLSCEIKSTSEGLHSQLAMTQEETAAVLQEKESQLQQYRDEIEQLRKEQEQLMGTSISRLEERSKIIESIIGSIGVDVKIKEDPNHSGGAYIAASDENYGERLLANTDKYLEILEGTPLGKPVSTRISSRYGVRKDPLNKKRAFHEGIDFKGKSGDKIKATASGKVKKSTYSKSLGHYVIVTHLQGYETLFAHMKKRLVKRGEKVKRGDIIGLVGSTGRSTGPHLHYEIHRNGKHVDPLKYIKVADLRLKIKQ